MLRGVDTSLPGSDRHRFPRHMAVTLREIAAECGVSKVTVSRVLSQRGGRHSAKTRRAILEAAKRLGYMPNASARAVSTGRFGSVALVLSTKSGHSHLPAPMLDGAELALEKHDYHLTVAKLPDETLGSDGHVPKFLRQWMADGLLINYTHDIPARIFALIRKHQIPAVWVNSPQAADCVYQDNLNGARAAARRLIDLGHRRIAYLDLHWGSAEVDHVHYSVLDRQRGYEQAMAAAGLAPRVVRPLTRVGIDDRPGFIRKLLSGKDAPTAFVCYWLDMAIPAMLAAKSLGLALPHDLSISTFASEGLLANCGVNFSAMLDTEFEMGERAVEALMRKIQDPKLRLPPIALMPREFPGTTVAPPPD